MQLLDSTKQNVIIKQGNEWSFAGNSSNWFVENISRGIIAFAGVTSVLMTLFFGLAPFMLLGLAIYGVIKIRRHFR